MRNDQHPPMALSTFIVMWHHQVAVRELTSRAGGHERNK